MDKMWLACASCAVENSKEAFEYFIPISQAPEDL